MFHGVDHFNVGGISYKWSDACRGLGHTSYAFACNGMTNLDPNGDTYVMPHFWKMADGILKSHKYKLPHVEDTWFSGNTLYRLHLLKNKEYQWVKCIPSSLNKEFTEWQLHKVSNCFNKEFTEWQLHNMSNYFHKAFTEWEQHKLSLNDSYYITCPTVLIKNSINESVQPTHKLSCTTNLLLSRTTNTLISRTTNTL